ARSRSVMSADPALQPRPQKLGWLRKQRSIVKNWQLRFFVLRGQQLLYYKDEDEAKPQVGSHLSSAFPEVFSQICPNSNHLPGCSCSSFCSFPADLNPSSASPAGVAGEQPRAGQDPCVLMASSQAEMEEWVKSLRRALGSASGAVPRALSPAVFGQCLAQTMAYEQKFGQHLVPLDNLVRQLRDAFDAGERPSFDRDTDVHTVASLLKLYLRELPEPVVPWLQYEDFLLCGQALEADETKGHQELLKQLSLLPRDNYNLLSYICRFLYEIQLNSSVNKMSVDNLATVIGVNLIRPRVEDPAVIMRGTPQVQKVMTVMISDHQKLFPPSKDEPPSPPAPKHEKRAPVPRSSVGWGAAEDPRGCTQRQRRDHPNSSSTPGPAATSSIPGEDTEPTDLLGTWKTQPRKRTQTLPSRKSVLAAPGDKGSRDRNDVLASDFWKSSPHPVACDGHKRTLSHDLFKLLDLHRAENVAESGEGSGSSPSPASSTSEKEFLPCFSPSHESKEPASASSSPAEEPRPEQDSREFLQGMVHKLGKDLEAQRNDYEGQIESLQKENYEVWAKVVRLNQDLEQERRKSGELELRLKNVERSREELEKRTRMLEEDIKNLTK
ncbi:RHG25 protein, partial [Peucedramus taeniatus]|nr:RHG25 protein [Peucedramus taeniatus]